MALETKEGEFLKVLAVRSSGHVKSEFRTLSHRHRNFRNGIRQWTLVSEIHSASNADLKPQLVALGLGRGRIKAYTIRH